MCIQCKLNATFVQASCLFRAVRAMANRIALIKSRAAYCPDPGSTTAIWGAGAELVELTGVVRDKYLYRFGGRLPPAYIPYADSMEPTGSWVVVSHTHFRVSLRLYQSVDVGDEVVLTVREVGGERPRAIELMRGTSSTALQVADFEAQLAAKRKALDLQRAQRLADDKCAVLRNLGKDARVLEQAPIPEEDEEQLGLAGSAWPVPHTFSQRNRLCPEANTIGGSRQSTRPPTRAPGPRPLACIQASSPYGSSRLAS